MPQSESAGILCDVVAAPVSRGERRASRLHRWMAWLGADWAYHAIARVDPAALLRERRPRYRTALHTRRRKWARARRFDAIAIGRSSHRCRGHRASGIGARFEPLGQAHLRRTAVAPKRCTPVSTRRLRGKIFSHKATPAAIVRCRWCVSCIGWAANVRALSGSSLNRSASSPQARRAPLALAGQARVPSGGELSGFRTHGGSSRARARMARAPFSARCSSRPALGAQGRGGDIPGPSCGWRALRSCAKVVRGPRALRRASRAAGAAPRRCTAPRSPPHRGAPGRPQLRSARPRRRWRPSASPTCTCTATRSRSCRSSVACGGGGRLGALSFVGDRRGASGERPRRPEGEVPRKLSRFGLPWLGFG